MKHPALKNLFFKLTILMGVIVLLLASNLPLPVRAANLGLGIEPTSLVITTDDLDQISISFHESLFQSSGDDAELVVKGTRLVSGNTSIPLNSAKELLASLHDMYPIPRFVTKWKWSDDYPYERLVIKLKDGRQVVAESNSQFAMGAPWNIQVWQGQPDNSDLLGRYAILQDDFHAGANTLWQALKKKDFPRNFGLDRYYWTGEEKSGTVLFYVPKAYDGFSSNANYSQVTGLPLAGLTPFLPVLKNNVELRKLFDAGFSLFDATFDMTVRVWDRKPLKYSGMLALKAPDSPDVVVTLVTIDLGGNAPRVSTLLTAQAVRYAIGQRQKYSHLDALTSFLPGFVYLDDLRGQPPYPLELSCAENPDYEETDFAIEGLVTGLNAERVSLYHLPGQKAWTLKAHFERVSRMWDDGVAANMLETWFPKSLQNLNPSDLDILSTSIRIAYKNGTTLANPQLMALLSQAFPAEANIHTSDPVKEGDRSFASMEGELVIPEDGSDPRMIYCGHKSNRQPYNIADVTAPDPSEPRINLGNPDSIVNGWTWAFGFGTNAPADHSSVALTSSKPGYVHVVWSYRQEGVYGAYYAEGWADGTGWTRPQRLGEASYGVDAVSNSKGEVHLFWSTDTDIIGTMHVWRDASGKWQKPEYWKGMPAPSQILLDEDGKLHMAWDESDGWDSEFFYREWNPQTGLTQKENISRRLGDIGSNRVILKEDATGQVCAVWGHTLSRQQYTDPLSGQIFDESGIFFARRNPAGGWTVPEQIGVFAPTSSSFGFNFNANNEPMVAWQSLKGIQASMRENGGWSAPALLQAVVPLPAPAQYGEDRWSLVKAEVTLAGDGPENVTAVWSTSGNGIYYSRLVKNAWAAPKIMVNEKGTGDMQIVAGTHGEIHAIYTTDSCGLCYVRLDQKDVLNNAMSVELQHWYSNIVVDPAGIVYITGPTTMFIWKAYIPPGASHFIPTPLPAPEATVTSTLSPPASPTIPPNPTAPVQTLSPTPAAKQAAILSSNTEMFAPLAIFALAVLALTVMLIRRRCMRQER